MINRLLTTGVIALLAAGPAAAAMGDNYFPANPYDQRFCAGLETHLRSENASRIACTDATTAIVVEYYDYWPEAIGQSLALASQTGLSPGIVLVCRNDHAHCEFAAKAVESAFAGMKANVSLWDCGLLDASLSDCDKLE